MGYQQFARSGPGRFLVRRLGLPNPVQLRRYEPGAPVTGGPVLLGGAPGGRLLEPVGKLLAGIGVVLIVLGIEGSRLVARLERRRARLADPRPVLEHPYRPLRGDLVALFRAEFLDEARWRDVLYVGVNFPLVILEFVLIVVLWGLTIGLLAAPLTLTGVPAPWTPVAVVAGIVLLPIAASLTQLVAVLHRAVISGLIGTSETRELRRQAETLRHAARQARHQGVALVAEVDQVEDPLAFLAAFPALDAVGGGEELEIFADGEVLVGAEEVGHVADVAADEIAVARDVPAEHFSAAGGRGERREGTPAGPPHAPGVRG